MELEGDVAAERLAGRELRDGRVHARQPVPQACGEVALLCLEHAGDERALGREVGVGSRHRVDHGLDHGDGDAGPAADVHTEQTGMPDRATHQATQHVAAALLRRQHPVADEEGRRARVLGDDPQRHVHLRVRAVGVARELARAREERLEEVGLEDVVDPLEQHREPLEAEPRVDVLRGQVAEDVPLRVQRVLHEDEVVVLEVALVVDGRTAGLAVLLATVVVELRVRTARARGMRPPVVVVGAEPLQA